MADPDFLARHLDLVLDDATIPELPSHYRGKVRDNYDLPDGRRLIVATDTFAFADADMSGKRTSSVPTLLSVSSPSCWATKFLEILRAAVG